jgi:hypothetical protein
VFNPIWIGEQTPREAFAENWSRNNHKGGKASFTVKPCRLLVRCALAERVCLLGSIAVTFGTLGQALR